MNAVFFTKLGGLFVILASSAALAEPILSIQPPQAAEPPGGAFNLDVDIQGATDVFAFQFDLTFAPQVLVATAVTEGSFLASAGRSTFFIPGTIGFGTGTITSVADTLLGPGPGASGDGTLATVAFVSASTGGTTEVALSNVLLLDSSLHPIPSGTFPSAVGVAPESVSCALVGFALLGMLLVCRRKWRSRIWAIGLLVLAIVGPARAAAPGYKFTILAQTGDTIAGKMLTSVGDAAINDAGTVVFLASFSGGSGIFTPSELLVPTGDAISGGTVMYLDAVAISDRGTVFFNGNTVFPLFEPLVPPDGIIAGKTIVGFVTPGLEGPFFSISHGGKLVFAGFTPSPYSQLPYSGIFTPSELVAQAPDPFSTEYYSPVINDAGMVVFGCSLASGVAYNICSLSEPVLNCGSEGNHFPAINNSGSVVSHSESQLGPNGICPVAHGSAPGFPPASTIGGKKLVDVPYAAPAINNPGTVLFQASFEVPNTPTGPSQAFGLFTSTELLLTSGDTIGGKTVASNPYWDCAKTRAKRDIG